MKKKNLYVIIAFAVFAVLFSFAFSVWNRREKTITPQIVMMGDSILGQVREDTGVSDVLEKLTGMSVFNGAFGGSCAARMPEDVRMDYSRGSLTLVQMAKSIHGDDFRVQQAGKYRDNLTDYFDDVIEDYARVNFQDVEIIVIQHGVNDYHAGIPIENPADPYDEYTFLGALRMSVELLKEVNPEARIVLVTPAYSWYVSVWKTCEEMDYGGGFLEEYVNAELALAGELGVEVIDMYHDFVPTGWEDCALYSQDGIHPNEAGRKLWAERIGDVLMK